MRWCVLLILSVALSAQTAGEHQFHIACAPCHGAHGEGGRGPALAVPKLPRAPDDAALSSIISLGIPGTQMPATRMTADERQQVVAYVRQLGRTPSTVVEGNRKAGEQIFWVKGTCGHCHTIGARGGHIGPDLTAVGSRRGATQLRSALIDPAASIPDTFTVYRRVVSLPDNFLQVRVITRDAKVFTGVRVDEDAFTIQIRDYSDRFYSFRKDDVLHVLKDWGKTPMPSFRGTLSDEEIRDLVAYLASLRGSE